MIAVACERMGDEVVDVTRIKVMRGCQDGDRLMSSNQKSKKSIIHECQVRVIQLMEVDKLRLLQWYFGRSVSIGIFFRNILDAIHTTVFQN